VTINHDRQHRQKMAEGVAFDVEAVLASMQGECQSSGVDGQFYAGGWDVLSDNLVGEMPDPKVPPRHAAERRIRLQLEEHECEALMDKAGLRQRKSATRSWPGPGFC
jgi:hypothetical protein